MSCQECHSSSVARYCIPTLCDQRLDLHVSGKGCCMHCNVGSGVLLLLCMVRVGRQPQGLSHNTRRQHSFLSYSPQTWHWSIVPVAINPFEACKQHTRCDSSPRSVCTPTPHRRQSSTLQLQQYRESSILQHTGSQHDRKHHCK